MRLTILGSGSSAGTPVIGCSCATCASANPRNQRMRCSSVIQLDSGENLLLDTGPDLRQQALKFKLKRIDAVLYTHTHADHLHGIDDLRAFCYLQQQQIPLYARADATEHIKAKFGYTLREPSDFWEMPVLKAHTIDAPFELFGQTIMPIPVLHGKVMIHGYRVGNLAYITDVSDIPESSMALLKGLDVLLIDCLRRKSHPTHIGLEQTLAYIGLIQAKRNVLIHMTHELEYAQLSAELPNHVEVGFDGLEITL